MSKMENFNPCVIIESVIMPSNLPEHNAFSRSGDILLSLTGERRARVFGVWQLIITAKPTWLPNVVPFKTPDRICQFAYLMFRQRDLQLRLEAIATGVAQQNLSPIKAGKLTCVTPSARLLARFSNFVKPYIDQILNLNQKNVNLRQTRDLLLPKLISGELDVSELDIDTD